MMNPVHGEPQGESDPAVSDDRRAEGDREAAPADRRSPAARAVTVLRAGRDHPLVVVAVVVSLVGLGHAVWIWKNRHLGAIDPDEAGYIANAFRYRTAWGNTLDDPLALPRALGTTGNGPLVPLLSVPLLWIGPDDARTVMMVLPLLTLLTSVSVAGITRRLAGPGASIVAGITFSVVPTTIFATQTYWLGLGAAAAMAAAMWALLESESLTNRWTYAYGLAFGCMLLTRTMTLGYVPSLVVAGLTIAWWRRDSLWGLARAMAVAAVVALPWWVVEWDAIFGYLTSYGYGDRAGLFGSGGPSDRLFQRLDRIVEGTAGRPWMLLVLAMGAAWTWWRRGRPVPAATRDALAVAAALGLGVAALASTSNNGVWFELPLVALAIALVTGVAAAAPLVLRVPAVVFVAVLAVLHLACAWWIIPPESSGVPFVASQHRVAQYEYGFEQYDPRFGPLRRSELVVAADDWWTLSTAVERDLDSMVEQDRTVISLSGNFQMFNSNTVRLAAEMRGWTPRIWIPDTVVDADRRERDLSPEGRDLAGAVVTDGSGRPVERIVVLARHEQHLFTPDAEVDAFARQAHDAGWEVVARHPIPTGGVVEILRHPDAPGGRGDR